MQDRVTLTLDDDGVAHVALNRPDKMNALDAAMFESVLAALDRLAGMRGLRAVVLSGGSMRRGRRRRRPGSA